MKKVKGTLLEVIESKFFNWNIYFFILIRLMIFTKLHSLRFCAVYFYFMASISDLEFQTENLGH